MEEEKKNPKILYEWERDLQPQVMNIVNEINQRCLGKRENKAVQTQRKTSRDLE